MNAVSLEGKYSNSCGGIGTSAVPAMHHHPIMSSTNAFHKYSMGQQGTSSYKGQPPPALSTSTYISTPAVKPTSTMSFLPLKHIVGAQGTPSTCTTTGTRSEASVSTPSKSTIRSPHRPRVVGLEPRAFVPRAVERKN
jgi:hypothetical protein